MLPEKLDFKNYPNLTHSELTNLDENNSLRKQLNFIGNGKRVLEFGCATGYFSQLLVKAECEVVGIEINPDAANVASEFCEQVIVADLDYVSILDILGGQDFDVAVFGDVLEHLRDPWALLKEVRTILRPSGYVVASIPNIAHGAVRLSLLQGEFNYSELGILDNTHLRFFTRKTVYELFDKADYEIEAIDRTIIPIFSGSNCIPTFNRNELSEVIIHQVESAEDSDTLQFVVRAFPKSVDTKFDILRTRYVEVVDLNLHLQVVSDECKSDLEEAYIENIQLKIDIENCQRILEQTCTELSETQAQHQKIQDEIQAVQASLRQSEYRYHQVETSLTYQIALQSLEYEGIVDSMNKTKIWRIRDFILRIKAKIKALVS